MDRLRSLNPEQVAALLRTGGQMLGAALGMFGYMNEETWALLSGPAVAFLLTIWGVVARKDTALLESAAGVPGTQAIVVASPEVAANVPSDKVTSSVSATTVVDPAVPRR